MAWGKNKEGKLNSNILYGIAGVMGLAVAMAVSWALIDYFDKCSSAKDFFISNEQVIVVTLMAVSVVIGVSLLGRAVEFCCSEQEEFKQEPEKAKH